MGLFYGHITLVFSILFSALAFYIALKSNIIDKYSLTKEIDSNIGSINKLDIAIGDNGTTRSRSAPIRQVLIKGNIVEAKAEDDFIDEQKEIIVIKVFSNNIIVKLK